MCVGKKVHATSYNVLFDARADGIMTLSLRATVRSQTIVRYLFMMASHIPS